MINDIFKKIDEEAELNKEDIVCLLSFQNEELLSILYKKADAIRKKYVGDEVHLRGLIEFSNHCMKNCKYCGIRRENKSLSRYRMNLEEILDTVIAAEKLDYKSVVLQSGEDRYYSADKLVWLIQNIKEKTNLAITLSIGERPREEYKQMREAGADRFLLRFETSNRELYAKLHPDSEYENRMQSLKWLRETGYQVGSGIMIGLPGQTIEDLANDILKFEELELDMIGMGPFICHQDTPLAGNANGKVDMTFKVIAVSRIVTRNTHIPATTALATLQPKDGRKKALQLGANVIMPNVTPMKYRHYYELYPDKACITEDAQNCRKCIEGRLNKIGRSISREHGHSLKAIIDN